MLLLLLRHLVQDFQVLFHHHQLLPVHLRVAGEEVLPVEAGVGVGEEAGNSGFL
jgi:hypothetical protein